MHSIVKALLGQDSSACAYRTCQLRVGKSFGDLSAEGSRITGLRNESGGLVYKM
jgi:hypothetical protein